MTNNFPVMDITHKPKRMQGDSIRKENLSTVSTVHSSVDEDVLEVITLERAIHFYEELAAKNLPNYKLYSATAKWLKELLATRNIKVMQQVNAERVEVDVNNADYKE